MAVKEKRKQSPYEKLRTEIVDFLDSTFKYMIIHSFVLKFIQLKKRKVTKLISYENSHINGIKWNTLLLKDASFLNLFKRKKINYTIRIILAVSQFSLI